ncbi:conserved hypothetical protein [Rubrivivax sp. A210]|uniref:late competence development ComFB family protein n=1 Tax=Rubrivivax sp. A210 TaxID=2772301 RepID=UPI001918D42D|nr:late competence development ComFB family protein [Rubrivivax sp. A210]CAD5373707.1 conserved hypothetical protein [Rubrivivax sp. A210]
MTVDFTTVHNHNENAVFDLVLAEAARHPGVGDNPELLADVACVALNKLAPRYIRHQVDYVFYLSNHERTEHEHALQEAVEYAFGFVKTRVALRSRV